MKDRVMRSYTRSQKQPYKAFTLIEILVVIAIIGLLAAMLFPIFKSTRQRANQTNCTANLRQIGVALQLYKQDEKQYPESLRDLLPDSADIPNYAADTAITNANGTGFLKTTKDALTCIDDDTDASLPRSSYGDISVNIFAGPDVTQDMGRFVWNYWGYKDDGTAFRSASEAKTFTDFANVNLLVDPNLKDSGGTLIGHNAQLNPIKYSLSYRYAPAGTIVTHCVYHRLPTANNLDRPGDLYTASANDARDARDIILRLDGSVRTLDVTKFNSNGNWKNPTF